MIKAKQSKGNINMSMVADASFFQNEVGDFKGRKEDEYHDTK